MNRKPAQPEITAASNINDCVRFVTAFRDVEDMKDTGASYYPKFYGQAANRAEERARLRVVNFWNAWAPKHGRLALAFIQAPPKLLNGAAPKGGAA